MGTLLEPPALLTVGAVMAAGLAAVYFGVRHSERAVRASGVSTGSGVAAGLPPADDEEEWGVDEPPLPEKRRLRQLDDAIEASGAVEATRARDEDVRPAASGLREPVESAGSVAVEEEAVIREPAVAGEQVTSQSSVAAEEAERGDRSEQSAAAGRPETVERLKGAAPDEEGEADEPSITEILARYLRRRRGRRDA